MRNQRGFRLFTRPFLQKEDPVDFAVGVGGFLWLAFKLSDCRWLNRLHICKFWHFCLVCHHLSAKPIDYLGSISSRFKGPVVILLPCGARNAGSQNGWKSSLSRAVTVFYGGWQYISLPHPTQGHFVDMAPFRVWFKISQTPREAIVALGKDFLQLKTIFGIWETPEGKNNYVRLNCWHWIGCI